MKAKGRSRENLEKGSPAGSLVKNRKKYKKVPLKKTKASQAEASSTQALLLLTTVPKEDVGKRIAQTLVAEKLAACVSLIPIQGSIYFWEGKMVEEPEYLLLIKTESERLEPLKERLPALHPYTVPEILAFAAISGGESYLRWISETLKR